MNTGNEGIRLIKNYEGCRLTAYQCSAGVWTIGWGHTGKVDGKAVCKGMTITQAKADALLVSDLVVYENHVKALKRSFNQNEFDALVSFTYNCGQGSLQTLCKNRSNKQIAEALLKYNKAGGKALAGLTKRRKAERELFLKPVEKGSLDKLPCDVKTTCVLNIRTAAGTNYPVIRVAKKGEILKVWAICTSNGMKWGKNGNEWYCLDYCEIV